jgi:Cytochrome C'
MALPVMLAGLMKLHGEDRVPGLTGIDRSDDVIQARQLLMDGFESEMMVIELGLEGKTPQLDDLKARADRISTLLTAFPHLFPPQTKPGVAADGSPITATLALWQNFDPFYDIAKGAATTAYDIARPRFRCHDVVGPSNGTNPALASDVLGDNGRKPRAGARLDIVSDRRQTWIVPRAAGRAFLSVSYIRRISMLRILPSPRRISSGLAVPVKPAPQTSSGSTQKSCAPPATAVMHNT